MFRDLNYDYECVGFYQAVPFGSCYDEDIVSLLVEHQKNIEHAVALIYDPIRTEQGKLSLRAFRLSSSALEICEKGDLSPKEMKAAGLTLKNMFDEFPVVIKNSHLHNVFLAQLEMDSVEKGKSYECGATAFKMASPALLGQRVRLLIKETEGQLQTADAMRKRRN
uniref:EIF3h_C domain-containing protein n=1 Tax=Steinernema glaseri TaxID=37863 RepID=A0A1I8ABE3_9BILA